MSAHIRPAKITDAEGMLEIYAPIVENSAISFEFSPPSLAEFRERIAVYSRSAPWLVCELNGGITGYAYATAFRSRPAYQWSAEVTVYVHPDFQRRGIARALYVALLDCLVFQGFVNAVGVIVLPNPASVELHQTLGFERIGVFPRIGFKRDAWHDTGWWLKRLVSADAAPQPLRTTAEAHAQALTSGTLNRASGLIRPG